MTEEYIPEIFEKLGVHTLKEAQNRICECGHLMSEHKFFEDKCSGVYLDEETGETKYDPSLDEELTGGTSVFNDGCTACECMEYRQTLR